jgi:copper chaperone CopZ
MTKQTLEVPVLIPDAEDCTACVERLRGRLGLVNGIAAAELDATGRRLTLTYDPAVLSLDALEAHVKSAGLALTQRFRHATLGLQGLDCPECAGAVEHSVTHVPGVLSAAANFAAASLYVEYDAEITDLDRIAAAVGRVGYRALVPGAGSGVVVVRVAEMDCQDEVKAIEGALRALPGVASWQVNLLERTLRVQIEIADTGPEAILAAIRGLGMTPELTERAVQAVAWRRDPLFLSTVTSGICLGAALIMDWAGNIAVGGILATAAMLALAHLYQGRRGLVSTFVVGLLLSAVRAWTGSLLPSLVAHFVADLTAGLMAPARIRSALAKLEGTARGPAGLP